MYYINDDIFSALLKGGKPVATRDPWGLRKRIDRYPSIRWWDSGERIGVSSGQWEERARLIDTMSDTLLLEVQEVYWGQCFGDKPPAYYRIPRALYENALVEEGAAI